MDWNNKEAVLRAVSKIGYDLGSASQQLKADRDVVLIAVSSTGYALEFASPELRADRKIVLTAVSEDGDALRFAAPELKNDREVVLTAVSNSFLFRNTLNYASPELQEEIKAYPGGAPKLLEDYEKKKPLIFGLLNGEELELNSLFLFKSIDDIKKKLNEVSPNLGNKFNITYDGEIINNILEFRRIFFNIFDFSKDVFLIDFYDQDGGFNSNIELYGGAFDF